MNTSEIEATKEEWEAYEAARAWYVKARMHLESAAREYANACWEYKEASRHDE